MRTFLFVAWFFIGLIAAYDCHFMWQNRATVMEWELNPVARFIIGEWGVEAMFAFKGLALLFAAVLISQCQPRLANLATTAIVSQHFVLGLLYLFV